mgnify:CR=1 FL=1
MKKSINKISTTSKGCTVLNKLESTKVYGGRSDHGDNGGIPPDNDK